MNIPPDLPFHSAIFIEERGPDTEVSGPPSET
ncbi:Uncharacterised protein [Mycobacteroides abscessus subsp. abscessus]|nr:Uncharacterised protein [Mycobacteroides abscessus subsp. abscessus]